MKTFWQISFYASRPSPPHSPAPAPSARSGGASSPAPAFSANTVPATRSRPSSASSWTATATPPSIPCWTLPTPSPPTASSCGTTWATGGASSASATGASSCSTTRGRSSATGDRRCVATPGKLRDTGAAVCNGAVLCAGHGPGHVHGRDCHSSAFLVVMIGINRDEKQVIACVYSSETREWGHFRSTEIDYWDDINTSKALIGNSLYWFIDNINISYGAILEFDLVRSSLATIKLPPVIMDNPDDFSYQIVQAEDGGVCLAVTTRDTLAMWDRKVGCNGDGTWVLRKAVKLEEVTGLSRTKRGKVIIHGYDEDDNAIFLRTDIGCFMVQLESMQFRNLGKRDFITTCAYYPYRSFYLPKGFTLDYQMVWDDCIGRFEQQKLVLQEVLNSADCRISLSIDTLTMNETTGYICVTCHFINTDWKVQKRIIKFFVVEKPYNGVEILNAVLKCIQEWNIEETIFAITLRVGTANDLMVNMLKHNLLQKKVLPLEGNLFCNSCVTHTINLIVNNGLRFADPIASKIRESVKYIQSSVSRMQMFEEIIAEDDISYEHWPTLDTPTSWHSTYCLLKMALEYRSVFNSLGLKDANYTYAPSFEEWERMLRPLWQLFTLLPQTSFFM